MSGWSNDIGERLEQAQAFKRFGQVPGGFPVPSSFDEQTTLEGRFESAEGWIVEYGDEAVPVHHWRRATKRSGGEVWRSLAGARAEAAAYRADGYAVRIVALAPIAIEVMP